MSPADSVPIKRLAPPRARLLTAAALLSGVLLAGCGAGRPSPTSAANTSVAAASEIRSGVPFSRCIRSHEVPNFPDPKVRGHHVQMGSPGTLESPAFQSAAHACQRLLPKGPPGPESPSGPAQTRTLGVSA